MSSLLLQIQNTVQKYADIISRVAEIDVEVVDTGLFRVAGTGIFESNVNEDMSGEGNIYRHVIKSGETMVIDNPRDSPLCLDCRKRENCKETIELSEPISMDHEIIGVIGLVGSTEEQRDRILNNRAMYLELIDQITDFIAVKARDHLEAKRRGAIISTLGAVINQISQGILIIGQDGIITTANDIAKKIFCRDLLEGLYITIENTGDYLSDGAEYKLCLRDTELTVYGIFQEIDNPSDRFAKMLIFRDSKELLDSVYEMTNVVNEIAVGGIIGSSDSTKALKKKIAQVAKSSSTVLITGESGTGKEVIATAIWKMSGRTDEKFVAINCAAIPEALLESELFGYVKGAFSGADPKGRIGKFELANKGVLFLDEIGDMPLYLQVKLLRVLQERTIVRIGSNQLIPIDVRVIAATNQDLKEMIKAGKFREDLFYRLNVIPMGIAPLRERPEDIEDLAVFFAKRYAELFEKGFSKIDAAAMSLLRGNEWRGNVRELENTIEFMVNMMDADGILGTDTLPLDFPGVVNATGDGDILGADTPLTDSPGVEKMGDGCVSGADTLPTSFPGIVKTTGDGDIPGVDTPPLGFPGMEKTGDGGIPGADTLPPDFPVIPLRDLEYAEISKALAHFGNNTSGKRRAAAALGISLATLYRKLGE